MYYLKNINFIMSCFFQMNFEILFGIFYKYKLAANTMSRFIFATPLIKKKTINFKYFLLVSRSDDIKEDVKCVQIQKYLISIFIIFKHF